jgi:hypothetical protein
MNIIWTEFFQFAPNLLFKKDASCLLGLSQIQSKISQTNPKSSGHYFLWRYSKTWEKFEPKIIPSSTDFKFKNYVFLVLPSFSLLSIQPKLFLQDGCSTDATYKRGNECFIKS